MLDWFCKGIESTQLHRAEAIPVRTTSVNQAKTSRKKQQTL